MTTVVRSPSLKRRRAGSVTLTQNAVSDHRCIIDDLLPGQLAPLAAVRYEDVFGGEYRATSLNRDLPRELWHPGEEKPTWMGCP